MSVITVSIHGKDYQLACDNGQEEHLRELAYQVDDRLRQMEKKLGGTASGHGEEMLLFMLTAITMTDELNDIKSELDQLHQEMANTSHSFERSKNIEMEQILAGTIDEIAQRIERMADKLESKG